MQWSKRKLQILIAVLAVILITLSGTAGVMAKYATTTTIPGQVTLTADIGQVGVWETPVEYSLTGGYVFIPSADSQDGKVYATSHSYTIIPGLDIPKDTIVRVDKDLDNDTNRTDDALVPAYVYLIVETTNLTIDGNIITSGDNGILCTLETHWKALGDPYPGVYVYCNPDTKEPVAVSSSIDIGVLVNDYIYVSQYVYQNISDEIDEFQLEFTATMRQYVNGKTAEEIYSSDQY